MENQADTFGSFPNHDVENSDELRLKGDLAYSISDEAPPYDCNGDCCDYHLLSRNDDHDIQMEKPGLRCTEKEYELEKAETSTGQAHLETGSNVVSVSTLEVGQTDDHLDMPLNAQDTINDTTYLLKPGSYKYDRKRPQSSMTVNPKELKLKYPDDEWTERKQNKPDHKQNNSASSDGGTAIQPLDIYQFLKYQAPKVPGQIQQVYMLHLSTPVSESTKSTTEDPSFPQGCHEEMTRLATYTDYPHDCPVFVTRLAGDGFVYLSDRKTVDCNFCRASIPLVKLYEPGADIRRMHRAMKPDCPFIQGVQCGNTPVPPHESFNGFQSQATKEISQTSVAVGEVGGKPALPVAASNARGFSSGMTTVQHLADVARPSPAVQPPRNQESLQVDSSPSIQQAHEPEPHTGQREHNQSARQPQHTQSLPVQSAKPANAQSNNNSYPSARASSSSNTASAAPSSPQSKPTSNGAGTAQPEKKKLTYADLGIFAEKPKRMDMSVMSKRITSFTGKWNSAYTQKPDMLADAGMYYAGYADCARCFFCGGGLKNWEPPDNPWIEHARWFPKCAYIRMCKGPMFVEIVQRKNKAKEEITIQDVEREIVQNTTGKVIPSVNNAAPQPAAARTNRGITVDIDQLEAENEELKSEVTCKICMDEESSVVFLPCGHLVACTHCAIALKNCPLCRAEIKGSVKAHMA